MRCNKTLLSAFNLYKGGSFALYLRMEVGLKNNSNVISVVSVGMENDCLSSKLAIIYPVKYFNSVYRSLIEQLLIPFYAYAKGCDSLVMMGNIASLFWFGRQTVYFHNMLYLASFENEKLFFKIEKLLFFISMWCKKPRVFVQSDLIADEFRRKLPYITDLRVIGVPSADFDHTANKLKHSIHAKKEIILLYPAFFYPHKNHRLLADLAGFIASNNIKIILTISEIDALNNQLNSLLNNPSFIFLGNQRNESMKSLYEAVDGLLFLSLEESLGMPLVEAVEYNLPVIAPNLPYADAAIENFYSFEPLIAKSLIGTLKVFLQDLSTGNVRRATSRLTMSPISFLNELTS